jgi:hypothetical protein
VGVDLRRCATGLCRVVPVALAATGLRRSWDDEIAPHTGFDLHHHENIEIVSYLREGTVTHVVFAHDLAHRLVVHCPPAPLQFGRDRRSAIAREIERDALDFISQIQILIRMFRFRLEAIHAGPADAAQLAHSLRRHRDALLDLALDVLAGRGFPASACSIRCSSMRCKHPSKKSISRVCCPTLRSS